MVLKLGELSQVDRAPQYLSRQSARTGCERFWVRVPVMSIYFPCNSKTYLVKFVIILSIVVFL